MSKIRPMPGRISDTPTQQAIRTVGVALDQLDVTIDGINTRLTTAETALGGTGVVTSVAAGSSMVTVTPSIGNVIVDVVPANFAGISQSSVTGLVADLAAINTSLAGKIDEVIAGTNLSGGGTSGSVTLNVVASPTFSGLTLSTFTPGSVLFAGSGGLVSQDNTNLFWDNTSKSLSVTSPSATAIGAKSNSTSAGTMFIQNTNVAGPSDFYATDNAGIAKISFGYGNASYSDTARQSRAYVWRNSGVTMVFARTGSVDALLDTSGNWEFGANVRVGGKLHIQTTADANHLQAFPAATGGKITLYPVSASQHYGLGVQAGLLQYYVATSADHHVFGHGHSGAFTETSRISANGNASFTGNVTLGDASVDTVQANGYAGFGAAPDVNVQALITTATTRQYGVRATTVASAATATRLGGSLEVSGTYDTTAGALNSIAVQGVATSTRSAGANTLINFGGLFTASGAPTNRALQTNSGDVLLNATDGNTGIGSTPTTAQKVVVLAGTAQNGVSALNSAAGQAGSVILFNAAGTGTFDTTAAVRDSKGLQSIITSTRSAGANNLTNTAALLSAAGAQINRALQCNAGDVYINASSGVTAIGTLPNATRQLTVQINPTASITGGTGVYSNAIGTYDTTAGQLDSVAVSGFATSTRSSGANNLNNFGGLFTATGGQTNIALQTNEGDVRLNAAGGITYIFGATTIDDDLTVGVSASTSLLLMRGYASVEDTLTGQTASRVVLQAASSGTFNTTASVLDSVAVYGTNTSSRSAGANNLTNVGGLFSAGAAQLNYAIKTLSGDVWLNSVGGTVGINTVPVTTAKISVDTSVSALGITVSNTGFATNVRATKSGTNRTGSDPMIDVHDSGQTFALTSTCDNIALRAQALGTKSSGANTLTNYALFINASGADVNIALQTHDGNVVLNNNSGTTSIKGNTTLGTGSSGAHTLNGKINFANAPTAGSITFGSANGRIIIGQQIFTAGGTYTPTTGTKAVRVRMVGGGGGGGGAAGGVGTLAAAGGGSSGVYWEKFIDPAATVTGGTVTIGAAGAGGAAGANNGSDGGDTSVVVQSTTYTAKGGKGGTGSAATSNNLFRAGGDQNAGSSVGDIVLGNDPGGYAMQIANSNACGGKGGSCLFGAGGAQSNNAAAAGNAGNGKGAGGGGAYTDTTSRAGGSGTAGVVIIEEYA